MKISHGPKPAPLVRFVAPLAVLLVATVGSQVGSAQQTVPFQGGIPVAPSGLAGPSAAGQADGVRHRRRTADPRRRRDEGARVSRGASRFFPTAPCSSPSAPAGCGSSATACSIRSRSPARPASYWAGESGLPGAVHGYMDIALHPQFAENQLVYLTYTKPLDEKRRTVGDRARDAGTASALTEVTDIFVADAAGTSRIAFGRDGTLFMTTDRQRNPAGSQHAGRQGAAASATTAACRPTTRSSGRPATSPRSTRSATAARSAWRCIRAPARCG